MRRDVKPRVERSKLFLQSGWDYPSQCSGLKAHDQVCESFSLCTRAMSPLQARMRGSADTSYLSAPRGPGGRAARWQLSMAGMSSARSQHTTPTASAAQSSVQTACSSLTWRLRKTKTQTQQWELSPGQCSEFCSLELFHCLPSAGVLTVLGSAQLTFY